MANLELVKKLRETTGCGIGDCNKALSACADNFEEAQELLESLGCEDYMFILIKEYKDEEVHDYDE